MTEMSPIREIVDWETAETFRAGMRRLASGVALVTAGTAATPVGLIVTALCSVSIDPPTLLVSISHSASVFDVVAASRRFVVNVLGEQHRDLIAQFTDPARRGERFSFDRWRHRDGGPPVLADALSVFDCRIVNQLRYSTHTIFLGRPTEAAAAPGAPIVHFERRFCGLA